jgi:DNA topoisomerase-1
MSNIDIKIQQKHLLYWLLNQFGGGGYKWETLEHNGLLFPPEYTIHGIPIIYDGKPVSLTPRAEEAAMLYTKYLDTEYINTKTFNKNFFNDWKKLLGKDTVIQDFSLCDFSEYKSIAENLKELKKNDDEKEEKEKKYKTAIVDGKEQPVGNFRVEPPGIFIGRGDNPNLGKIKKRIYPEDITINISKNAKVPDIPEHLNGHKWGKIVHDRHAIWLASWDDIITGKIKYMWLGASSEFKASSDIEKFDLARKLKKKIKGIREENDKNLKEGDDNTKQIATALYFIDKFAIRVGNEKGDDTDTVGVTTLRIEHIELNGGDTITLRFLGKDSIEYYNRVQVEDIVYKNMEDFMKGKSKGDQVFDKINSDDVNKYLQTFMKNLSAKVFRTYNASHLFQKELDKIVKKFPKETDKKILIDEYNKANAKVAILCNHQKNAGKSTHKEQISKIDEQIKKIKSQLRKAKKGSSKSKGEKIEKIQAKLKVIKSKKEVKEEMKNISIGTSRQNYIDQRISIIFFRYYDIPLDKIFSKTLIERFKWAVDVADGYHF